MEQHSLETGLTTEEVNEALEKAIEAVDDDSNFSTSKFSFSCKTVSFSKLLKDYKTGKLQIPLFQRLYVWSNAMRRDLLDTVKVNLPCGAISVGEVDGVSYLVDGQQRNLSLILLLTDEKALKKACMTTKDIMDYQVVVITTHDMTVEDLALWFRKLNSGILLAPIVKSRSNLSAALNDAVLEIARNPVFIDRDKQVSAVFKKSHHHELIAMNALLAAAGLELGENRAKGLCQRLKDNEESVLEFKDEAFKLVSALDDIFSQINPKCMKKSFSSNHITPMLYLMKEHPEIEFWKYAAMTNYIFKDGVAIDEYAATTRSGSDSPANGTKRKELMLSIMTDDSILGENRQEQAS